MGGTLLRSAFSNEEERLGLFTFTGSSDLLTLCAPPMPCLGRLTRDPQLKLHVFFLHTSFISCTHFSYAIHRRYCREQNKVSTLVKLRGNRVYVCVCLRERERFNHDDNEYKIFRMFLFHFHNIIAVAVFRSLEIPHQQENMQLKGYTHHY